MQRIGRPGDLAESGSELLEKVEILHRHFPPSIANMFALPKERNGTLEWWTELQGQVAQFKDLPSHEQQRLLQTTQQRLDAIGRLVAQLQSSGQNAQAQALQSLMGQPAPENLWSVNGEPLITSWAKPAPVAAVTAPAFVASPVAAPVAPVVPTRKRSWWWLLLPLLLLLLALLWLWWSGRFVWPIALPQLPQAGPAQCVNKSSEPPDFVMVVDTSGSMELNINISQAEEDWVFQERSPLEEVLAMPRMLAAKQEPQRMTVAKQALVKVVDELEPRLTTEVVTFGRCGTTYHRGSFDGGNKAAMTQMLGGLQANGQTPLALGMRHAASLVDGKNKDAMVLLFVDGEDGCGENVCQVAEQLHAQKPRMRINVVNISDKPLSNCVADITGGRVYAAKDANALAQHLQAATQEVVSCE